MPWTAKDARRHTKQAKTAAQKRRWAQTANAVLRHTGDEAKAVRIANSSLRKK